MKINILKTAILVVALVLAVPITAQQQGRGKQYKNTQNNKPNPDQVIARLDTNSDGKINKEEAAQAQRGNIAENFDYLDSNKDGYIVLEELNARPSGNSNKQMRKPSPEKIFEMLDNNKDGQLDKLEVAAKNKGNLEENFSRIDANTDDFISMEELNAFHATSNSKGKYKGNSKGKKRKS